MPDADGRRPADWTTVEALFESARRLPATERDAFLESHCAGDDALRRELRALLDGAPAAEAFFRRMADVVDDLLADAPATPPDAGVGTLVGRYRLEARLGAGGMGVVYRAYDTHLQRHVALKLLAADAAAGPVTGRLLSEARAAASLDHPNICTVHETGETAEGAPYLVMAYCEGETLAAKVARGPLPPAEALACAAQIARGLAAAHARGIIHRDVKPGNIIITAGGLVKLVDFGLARLPDTARTAPGAARGTVAYMAPEQLRGEPIDARADLWSLGVVLYEMVTGSRPFRADSAASTMYGILTHEPEPLPATVPDDVRRIVAHLLERSPADRYGSAGEVLADLVASGAPPGTGPLPSGPARTRRGLRLALVAGAVLAGFTLLRPLGTRLVRDGTETVTASDAVAVLFFQDHSAGRFDWLADGITRSLIEALGTVPVLRVRSTGAVWPYRDGLTPHRTVAASLDSKWLVDGNVRIERDTVVATAELVDGVTGDLLDTFEITRPAVQAVDLVEDVVNEVTSGIEAFLRRRIGYESRVQRWNREGGEAAFRLVHGATLLKAEKDSLLDAGRPLDAWASLRLADADLARAEAEDPAWVEPTLQRAWLDEDIAFLAFGMSLRRDAGADAYRDSALAALRRGIGHAGRVLDADSANAPAYEVRGILRHALALFQPADTAAAARHLRGAEADLARAIRLDAGLARAANRLSSIRAERGEFEEAARLAEQAWNADAWMDEAQEILTRLFNVNFEAGRDDRAARWCAAVRVRFPASRERFRCALMLMAWSDSTASPDSAWKLADSGIAAAAASDRARSRALFHMLVAGVLRWSRPDDALQVLQQAHATARDDSLHADPAGAATLFRMEAAIRLMLPGGAAEACALLRRAAALSGPDSPYLARSRRFRIAPADCLTATPAG